jgi:hypothetical protein
LPILAIVILVLIKAAVKGTSSFTPQTVPANFPDNNQAFVTLSFTDYLTAIQVQRVCQLIGTDSSGDNVFIVSGIAYKSYDWQVPFVKCDATYCKNQGENANAKYCEYNILALAPSSESDSGGMQRAKDFESYILNRYTFLNTTLNAEFNNSTLPFTYPLVQIFNSQTDIENYVTQGQYGTTGYPKIAMGVIFNGNAANNYDYILRLNSTNFYPGEDAQPAATTTPDPTALFSDFARDDSACKASGQGTPDLGENTNSCTHQYVYNGALVVQRLVNDFILVDSGAKAKGSFVAEHGVTYVSFPSRQYVKNGFYAQIARKCFLLLCCRHHNASRCSLSSPSSLCLHSICPPARHIGTALPCGCHDSLYCVGKGTSPEGAHENDVGERVRYPVGLVCFIFCILLHHRQRHSHSHHRIVFKLGWGLSLDLLGFDIPRHHHILHGPQHAHIQVHPCHTHWSLDLFHWLLFDFGGKVRHWELGYHKSHFAAPRCGIFVRSSANRELGRQGRRSHAQHVQPQ